MKPEQLEIAQLKREVIRLKAERDTQKKNRGLLREGIDVKFGFIAKQRAEWLCGALGISRGGIVRTASDRAIDAAAGSQSASATASPAARPG
jgi:long-subunit acyl-CoA synthetase (AMP-forming)